MIKVAELKDLPSIMKLVARVINQVAGTPESAWNINYPNQEIIANDIRSQALYVYQEKTIQGIITLTGDTEEYSMISWKYSSGPFLVLHRLCVDPQHQGTGIAKRLITFAEDMAKEKGCESLQLDIYPYNSKARNLYEQHGFIYAGTMSRPNRGKLLCYEKPL